MYYVPSNKKVKELSITEKKGGWDFSTEKERPSLTADSMLNIRPMRHDDLHTYVSIRRQYAVLQRLWENQELNRDSYEREISCEATFYCAIETKESISCSSQNVIGYIALKDTSKEVWEVAIEIDHAYCNKGYGPRAILLFLREICRLTERKEYQFTVEVDNTPCQKCMKKIGAQLVGLYSTNSFETEDLRKDFEERHLDYITEHIVALANKLHVEPRTLLSNVLDYRVHIPEDNPF